MPVITVQLGQCGNQLGCSLFQTLSAEFATGDYQRSGVEEWFRPLVSSSDPLASYGAARSYVARSVLIDMEPKVVNAVRTTAASTGGWWAYPAKGHLCMQSGAGNNWAHGFHGYGPRVRDAALNLIRKEAEACDVLSGFLVLQSMAGGTGAGLGTYVAEALRDEYLSSHCLNCCVWPYESGEVMVQSYNTLFTLSHLSEVSDGIITMDNDSLHRVCKKLYNIPRPAFSDINAVAARALACLLLPSSHRSPWALNTSPSAASSSGGGNGGGASHFGAEGGAARQDKRMPHGQGQASSSSSSSSTQGGGSSRPPHPLQQQPVRLLTDLAAQLCSHPWYRLLTLRALPQVPAASVDFTTFTWPGITRRLRQMLITGSTLEEGLDWGLNTSASSSANSAARSPPPQPQPQPPHPQAAKPSAAVAAASSLGSSVGGPTGRPVNLSLANWLVLRGQAAGEVDVSEAFLDPGLYPAWAADPLAVSCHPGRFARCTMAAALCSNDQSCVGPMRRMLDHAYSMLAARAYVHQYEKYGLEVADFERCFAHVEEIGERYLSL